MRTFHISTLGCKVNQYEGEQIATLLELRGLRPVDRADEADLRVVNTCSVTVQAASKSRQSVRRSVRLPLATEPPESVGGALVGAPRATSRRSRTIVTGCWATSDKSRATALAGVDAVLTHHDDVAAELDRLLAAWQTEWQTESSAETGFSTPLAMEPPGGSVGGLGRNGQDGTSAGELTQASKALGAGRVKKILVRGTVALPLLGVRREANQRAYLKVQDGCDAHCTYCIIPRLRPGVWSKPVEDAVREARALVAVGHVELVLTGIFLGAYGQATALRRRQQGDDAGAPLGRLVEALCTGVPGLRRLRLSSLEPGDLTPALVAVLRSHAQVVPHFHLPLQSGSDALLHRMNRQYTRDDFLRMVDDVRGAFDRPALTTDVIVGFPGETDGAFAQTLDVVERAGFVHVHAFSFSPRPGTAAARWTRDFIHGLVVNERIEALNTRARDFSHACRRGFVGETVELLVERKQGGDGAEQARHGRCERYFTVHFESPEPLTGQAVRVRIDRVTPHRTWGTLLHESAPGLPLIVNR